MFHTPPHKQTDKTLADYIQRKTDTPPKKTFEEYMGEMVLTKVGPRPREHALGEEKVAVAREAWIEARK
jgi:hypothetical protein